ncbi:MAG: hypothetical protein IJ680_08100 [Paludibacteraceae bacterium]|nr:hypothetical protein [Paludibacteraceae bacterium]
MRRLLLILCSILSCASIRTEAGELRLNAVKTTFLSWITGSSKICYERAWPRIHQSSDWAVVCIGAGGDKYGNHPLGYSVRYAHKFFFALNHREALTGFYIRPELIYSGYDYDAKQTHQRRRSDMGTLMGTIGYSHDWNHFVADAYFGSGYAWGSPADTGYEHGFSLWDYFGHYNPHISMTFGIRIGYSF